MAGNHKKFTETGTDIDEVKRKNSESGMSYNEVKAYLAEMKAGHRDGTDTRR